MSKIAPTERLMALTVMRYGLAVLCVVAALLVTELLHHLMDGPPWYVFLAAVMISSWVGGLGPGLLAVLLSILAIDYFFVPPLYLLTLKIEYLPHLVIFGLSALLISWLSDRRKRAEAALRHARDELEAKVQERTAELSRTNEELQAEIAERTRAEEELRERANLLDLTHDTVFVRDMSDVITYWNRGAEEQYGWTKEEALGKVTHQLLHTIFPAPLAAINAELLGTGRWDGELRHTKRDGTQVVVASRWSLQRDELGRPVATLETNNDITERQRAEAELRESARRYRHIFETAGVSIWEEDFSMVKAALDALKAQGVRDVRPYLAAHPEFVRHAISLVQIVDVNNATVTLFGARSKAELLGSLHAIFTPEAQEVFAGELVAIAEGHPAFASETVLQTLQGDKRAILFRMTFPPPPATYDRVLVSMMDITERQRAENALREAQAELAHVTRLTTMGELTASIAHEINQPLAAVVNSASACVRWLAAQNLEGARQSAMRVIADGHRAAEIIRRIRNLARKAPPQKDWLDLNDAIRDVIALVRGEAQRHGVTLETHLAGDVPLIMGDRIQLQQVLLNLLKNAIEAMSGVGEWARELWVRSERVAAMEVLVTVRDSGPGLEPQSLDRLFDAFYTTKPNGLGMGLAISRSIIEAHGGRLWATAHAPHGAVFQFTVPTGREGVA